MSQTQFVGSWNESGMLLDIFRKGFTTANCISELIANCIDAEASNIFVEINPLIQKKYNINQKKYKIDIHDDGIGMNLENLKNMFDMNNENHPDQKTMGIAGIGGKVSQAILSNKKNVYMFTRNTNGDEFYIYVPWKKIFIEKKFTNQIKIFKNYNKISENLIIEFNRIKNKLNHIKSGTIISIPINKDTIQDIDGFFLNKKPQEQRPDIIFGIFLKTIKLNYIDKNNIVYKIKPYDYWDNDADFIVYNEYQVNIFKQNMSENIYYVYEKINLDHNLENFIWFNDKLSKNITDRKLKKGSYTKIGTLTHTFAYRDNEKWSKDEPCEFPGEHNNIEEYDKDYFDDTASTKDEYNNFCAEAFIERNGQIISIVETNNKYKSARGSQCGKLKYFRLREKISYDIECKQENNFIDNIIGIQSNKNQHTKKLDKKHSKLSTIFRNDTFETLEKKWQFRYNAILQNINKNIILPPNNILELSEQPPSPSFIPIPELSEQLSSPSFIPTPELSEQPSSPSFIPTPELSEQPSSSSPELSEQPSSPSFIPTPELLEQPSSSSPELSEQPSSSSPELSEQPSPSSLIPIPELSEQPSSSSFIPIPKLSEQPSPSSLIPELSEQPSSMTNIAELSEQPLSTITCELSEQSISSITCELSEQLPSTTIYENSYELENLRLNDENNKLKNIIFNMIYAIIDNDGDILDVLKIFETKNNFSEYSDTIKNIYSNFDKE